MTLPTKWWQWVLVYPTLFIALIANIPQGLDIFQARKLGIPISSLGSAKEQRRLWERNIDCIKGGGDVFSVKTCSNDVVKVSACDDTGDVIVEVNHSNGEKSVRWIAFDTFSRPDRISSIFDLFTTNAYAGEIPIRYRVINQMWLNNIYLYRRVKIKGICWDEVINTYLGKIKSRIRVDCYAPNPYRWKK